MGWKEDKNGNTTGDITLYYVIVAKLVNKTLYAPFKYVPKQAWNCYACFQRLTILATGSLLLSVGSVESGKQADAMVADDHNPVLRLSILTTKQLTTIHVLRMNSFLKVCGITFQRRSDSLRRPCNEQKSPWSNSTARGSQDRTPTLTLQGLAENSDRVRRFTCSIYKHSSIGRTAGPNPANRGSSPCAYFDVGKFNIRSWKAPFLHSFKTHNHVLLLSGWW